jgi:hypothetical protein
MQWSFEYHFSRMKDFTPMNLSFMSFTLFMVNLAVFRLHKRKLGNARA